MSDLVSPFVGKRLDHAESKALAAITKVFSDPARLQLLSILHAGGEWSGQDLIKALGSLSQPTVSYHVSMLVDAGLVSARREGTRIFHRLVPERLTEVADLLRPARPR